MELQTKLGPEIYWALVKVQGRTLLLNWLPEGSINGVRRARALVHSKSVAKLLVSTASAFAPDQSPLTNPLSHRDSLTKQH